MLTPDQWRDLAAFAGLEYFAHVDANTPCVKHPPGSLMNEIWMPHEDWRDFGPLWVKLLRHPVAYPENDNYRAAKKQYVDAVYSGTEAELMQAGCLLGAAIQAAKGESK